MRIMTNLSTPCLWRLVARWCWKHWISFWWSIRYWYGSRCLKHACVSIHSLDDSKIWDRVVGWCAFILTWWFACRPLYQSEIAPPNIRGSLVSLQQLAITFGILISFWIDYGTQYIPNEAQWRVPLLLQLAIGIILGIGILFFPFSPRWLMTVGREEESLRVLSKLRRLPVDDPAVMLEWREIKTTVEFDRRVQQETYPDLLQQGRKGAILVTIMGYVDLFRHGMFCDCS